MGSLLTLHAYSTDAELEADHWGDVEFLDACEHCELCLRSCPCGCISRDNPVVDVGRCVTLYNEIAGEFPPDLDRDAHNSLVGCMACQLCCPENRAPLERAGRLEDVSEKETRRILDSEPDPGLFESLSRKLRGFPPATGEEYFPIMTRNLRVLLERSRQ
jgi:epoxyqueuosine reductase